MTTRSAASLALVLGALVCAPAYATPVTCADGSTSTSARGACSHHGGVAKARSVTECADHTTTTASGKGACSHHGGERAVPTPNATRTKPQPQPTTHRRSPGPQPVDRDTRADNDRYESSATGGTATARCRDGSLSYSQHHAGTCSKHGGVLAWITG